MLINGGIFGVWLTHLITNLLANFQRDILVGKVDYTCSAHGSPLYDLQEKKPVGN